MTSRPRPLREVRRALSDATDAVVQRALATNPADRFTTAAEFAAELVASTTETTAGRTEPRTPGLARMLATAVGAFLLLLLGWWAFPSEQSARAGQINRIAVLPLENLAGDSAEEYFAVGMTEAVITNLGQVGLNVLSRQSVGRLTAAMERLPEVARTLNVDAVVVGSVFRSADRLRVDVRFVDGATACAGFPNSMRFWTRSACQMQGETETAMRWAPCPGPRGVDGGQRLRFAWPSVAVDLAADRQPSRFLTSVALRRSCSMRPSSSVSPVAAPWLIAG